MARGRGGRRDVKSRASGSRCAERFQGVQAGSSSGWAGGRIQPAAAKSDSVSIQSGIKRRAATVEKLRELSRPPDTESRVLSRRTPRINVTFETEQVRGKGYLKSISHKGLFLRSSTVLAVDDEVRLTFRDRKGVKVEVRGIVGWTTEQLSSGEEPKPGFGVFVALEQNQAFVEFVEQMLFS